MDTAAMTAQPGGALVPRVSPVSPPRSWRHPPPHSLLDSRSVLVVSNLVTGDLTYDHLAAVLQQQLHARAGDPPALAWRNINIIRDSNDSSISF